MAPFTSCGIKQPICAPGLRKGCKRASKSPVTEGALTAFTTTPSLNCRSPTPSLNASPSIQRLLTTVASCPLPLARQLKMAAILKNNSVRFKPFLQAIALALATGRPRNEDNPTPRARLGSYWWLQSPQAKAMLAAKGIGRRPMPPSRSPQPLESPAVPCNRFGSSRPACPLPYRTTTIQPSLGNDWKGGVLWRRMMPRQSKSGGSAPA